jgi:hypothetical protein
MEIKTSIVRVNDDIYTFTDDLERGFRYVVAQHTLRPHSSKVDASIGGFDRCTSGSGILRQRNGYAASRVAKDAPKTLFPTPYKVACNSPRVWVLGATARAWSDSIEQD